MAEHSKGRAIVAVSDLSKNPALGRRANALAGTIIIYHGGRKVACSDGSGNLAFGIELASLGLAIPPE